MQLRKTTWMLAAVSALSMMMMACPGADRTDLACTTDTDCVENEICHPGAKVCVQTCAVGADCPSSAKTCEAISSSDNRLVCKCSTDALCGQDERVTGLTCSKAYSVCTGGGTATPACTKDADCQAGETCDTSSGTGTCKTSTVGQTCSGTGQAACTYGQFCSSSKCAQPTAPTCANYNNFSNKADLGTSGPIIFNAAYVSAATDGFCGSAAPKRVKVKISAYSNTAWPATKSQLNSIFYVMVDGTPQDATSLISESSGNYTVSGANADIVMSFCVASSSTRLSIGTYFKSGNFYCYQADY